MNSYVDGEKYLSFLQLFTIFISIYQQLKQRFLFYVNYHYYHIEYYIWKRYSSSLYKNQNNLNDSSNLGEVFKRIIHYCIKIYKLNKKVVVARYLSILYLVSIVNLNSLEKFLISIYREFIILLKFSRDYCKLHNYC
jgi:hypothetical protein